MRENSSPSPVVYVWPLAIDAPPGMTAYCVSPPREAPNLPKPGVHYFISVERLVGVLRSECPSITLDISAEAPIGFVFGGRHG